MKKIGKIALIVLAIIGGLFILIMLIPTNDDTEIKNSPVKEESVVETQPVETQSMSKEEFANMIEQLLAKTYGENNYYTKWNNNTYIINVWAEGLAKEAVYAKRGDEELLNSWTELVDATCYMSTTTKETALTNGLNIDVKVNILNDTNLNKVLLTVLNDEVLYNVVN